MKKLLLSISLLTSVFVNAQENWIQVESSGFMHGATFRLNHVFQNKIYVGGDTSYQSPIVGGVLYSSSSGDAGTFTEETGIKPVLQHGVLVSAADNGTDMFLGSEVKYDTTGGVTGNLPQVYHFNGSTYSQHGTIDYSTLPGNNQIASGNTSAVEALALYSPTGSNDTVYAFIQPVNGLMNNVSVFKAPANSATPAWINCTNFSMASGINHVYDAQVWHKKLYIAVNSNSNGGMILRTANGADWDTVVTAFSLTTVLGVNSFNDYFTALEVYKDTLVTSVINSFNASLVFTTDSTSFGQTWKALIDSAGSSIITANTSNISDMTVGDGKLWIETSSNFSWGPRGFVVTKNAFNRDTLLTSTGGTGLENGTNASDDYRLSYFNNSVYAVGHYFPGGRMGNPNGRGSSSGFAGTGAYAGNIWRFTTVNPVASFVDSVSTGSGYCQGNTIFLACTSANAASADWYLNGVLFQSGLNITYNPNVGETDVIKMVAYNGTNQSLYFDTISKTITIYWNPVIDTVTVSLPTICQGQPDTVKAVVQPGSGPYMYMWQYALNINGVNDSIVPFTLTTVSTPSPSMIGFSVRDVHGCQTNSSYVLYVYVNASDSLSGTIIDSLSNPVGAGKVYLYKKQVNNMGIEDTMMVLGASGQYTFPSLYYGDYYIKAEADTGNLLYKTAVPTYYSSKPYGHAYQWDSALVVLQHGCSGGNNAGNDIKIIQLPNMPATGPGTISGHLSESLSFGARYSGPNSVLGAPLKGIDIKLGKNPGGSPAARTSSDTSGNYIFTNVQPGNYKIYVDIPNYGMDSVRLVTIDSLVATVSVHNDYYVDSTMIRVVPVDSVVTAICVGDSIMLGGAYQNTAGIYEDILQTAGGYDSLRVTTLSIKSLPTLTLTATSYTVCSGDPTTLTASGATSFVWSSNAGSVATSTASINPTATDVYTVTGTNNGCSDIKTISINVNPLPTPTIGSNSPVCANQTLNLTAGGATAYSWSGPNSYTSSLQNPSVNTVATFDAGTYTVVITDANACFNTATVSVVVNPLPIVSPTGATVCVNGTINLTANGGTNYSWIGPVSYASNLQNPSIANASLAMSGSYVVTVTDGNGCSNGGVVNVVVNSLPIVTASGATVCANGTINMTSSGGGTYSWSGPNAFSSTGQNPNITGATVSMNGDYTVTVTDANNCSSSNTANVVVNALPNVVANASASTICSGSMVTLTGSGASTYTWSTGVTDGVAFAPTATDTYTVTGTDANMCMNSATITVTVTCVGVNQYSSLGSLSVYPVPAANSLFIEIEKTAEVKIFNLAGQIMMEQTVIAGKNEINTTNLPAGAYDLGIRSEGKTTYVKVMISK